MEQRRSMNRQLGGKRLNFSQIFTLFPKTVCVRNTSYWLPPSCLVTNVKILEKHLCWNLKCVEKGWNFTKNGLFHSWSWREFNDRCKATVFQNTFDGFFRISTEAYWRKRLTDMIQIEIEQRCRGKLYYITENIGLIQ